MNLVFYISEDGSEITYNMDVKETDRVAQLALL